MAFNDRFLRALACQPVDKTPVWIMRQAGRYLPEYRRVREQAGSFLTLCKTPELACEVTLQPLARFDLDAAIIFSDILTIPDAMGLGLHFIEGEGPRFERPLRCAADIAALPTIEVANSLRYVTEAIALARHELIDKVPLIGFSGSPWTLATYMIENGSSKTFSLVKRWLFSDPDSLHSLLTKLADCVVDYLSTQIHAGAQAVMLFDTWGGILTPRDYQQFSLYYMQRIIKRLKNNALTRETPVILFTKNGGQWLEAMAATGADGLGVDWTTSLHEARQRVGENIALQGNLDPAVLYASPERIVAEVETVLKAHGAGNGHVFNLGHGIQPDTPIDNVQVMVEAVHRLSAKTV